MLITVVEEPRLPLSEYQKISIAFLVDNIFEAVLAPEGSLGLVFRERKLPRPYIKEYDQPGHRPPDWAAQWDISNWGILTALGDGQAAGCAAVAWNTPKVDMLEGRTDISVLWDIRVAPGFRGQGVGTALFQAAVDWSRARKVIGMKIETQSINVSACRFYAAQGCQLSEISTRAYPDFPEETQMIWYLKIR